MWWSISWYKKSLSRCPPSFLLSHVICIMKSYAYHMISNWHTLEFTNTFCGHIHRKRNGTDKIGKCIRSSWYKFSEIRIFLSKVNFKVIAVITELPKAITLYFNFQTLHRIKVHSEFIHILLLCSDVSLQPLLQSFPLL